MRVFQEVASARCIVITCGTSEINDHTFYLGLRPLKRAYDGAIFRSKYASFASAAKLNQRSLAELVDMFRTHEATDRMGKVYAFLGMVANDSTLTTDNTGLASDYARPWCNVFQSTKNILGEKVANETDRGICQRLTVDTKASFYAKPVCEEDLMCFLQGARNPTATRLSKDHFSIVVVTTLPPDIVFIATKIDVMVDTRGQAVEEIDLDFELVVPSKISNPELESSKNKHNERQHRLRRLYDRRKFLPTCHTNEKASADLFSSRGMRESVRLVYSNINDLYPDSMDLLEMLEEDSSEATDLGDAILITPDLIGALLNSAHGTLGLETLLKLFEKRGVEMHVMWRVLNAAMFGDMEDSAAIKFLLKHGRDGIAKVTKTTTICLDTAVYYDFAMEGPSWCFLNTSMISSTARPCGDIAGCRYSKAHSDENAVRELLKAVTGGDKAVVDLLGNAGGQVAEDISNNRGTTPLYIAAARGNIDLCRRLLCQDKPKLLEPFVLAERDGTEVLREAGSDSDSAQKVEPGLGLDPEPGKQQEEEKRDGDDVE
ncbi:uncharacterized protein BDR25DRAFT_353845 [Lindgomyces ingoldianus]|uniref:Uncharacterized protein n=1 Tax=Lindgomyces ingoldianus TaxID=673940 RepID=A0ACB6QYX8_9PLEO|nr:uncharacterized protein BDR25DRAFT_353845 [Lindgomyces ingoldianus]KAF2472106.1 hypothetical protein BDR25DRAFT_353845 [Lindgomyces ingoldianus]